VLLVDDHELFRSGLRRLLEKHGFEVVGEAADGQAAVELAARVAPDVIVMDIYMRGASGIETTRRIRGTSPHAKVIMLTVSAEEAAVSDAVLAGACGYLLKEASPDEIVAGVRAAAAGGSLLSPRVAADLLDRLRRDPTLAAASDVESELTDREEEVLKLMALGKTNSEIAEQLFISTQTVKNHVSNILAKLDVHNRIQAAVYATRKRLS
jgi:DNA-binding NarL/FixJ family response regulator